MDTWYQEWKELWYGESKDLGLLVSRRFDGRNIRMDRRLWAQLNRVRRISERLTIGPGTRITWRNYTAQYAAKKEL